MIFFNPQLFLCGFAFHPHVSGKSGMRTRNFFKCTFHSGNFEYAKNLESCGWSNPDISNPMTLRTQMQSLLRKYSTWPLNEMLSLLLAPIATRTPDGACSVDNSHRGDLVRNNDGTIDFLGSSYGCLGMDPPSAIYPFHSNDQNLNSPRSSRYKSILRHFREIK